MHAHKNSTEWKLILANGVTLVREMNGTRVQFCSIAGMLRGAASGRGWSARAARRSCRVAMRSLGRARQMAIGDLPAWAIDALRTRRCGLGRFGTSFMNEGLASAVISERYHANGPTFLHQWVDANRQRIPKLAILADDDQWSAVNAQVAYNASA
jgi:hypothetical protein